VPSNATLSPLALSVVIPCFNEEAVLPELCRRVNEACAKEAKGSFEIILVNDGSSDGSLAMMKAMMTLYPALVIVNLARNHGHQLALTAGLAQTRGARVLILDADLQDPPELLDGMMRLMDESGADVVFGQRLCRHGESLFKRASASLFYRLFGKLTEAQIPADTGDFRLLSHRTVDLLNAMPEQSRFLRGMVGWMGLPQVPFPYERQPRLAGTTKYPLPKMLRFALDAITSFSIVPMRLASYTGALFGVIGLGLLIYVFRAWLLGETVQGWTSLMVVVLVIGSVQLLCLGVFGEYLGRLYMESKRRPLYIIESVLRRDNP